MFSITFSPAMHWYQRRLYPISRIPINRKRRMQNLQNWSCRCIGGHIPWIGALDDFFSRICFMTLFLWSNPSSRVVILLAFEYWNIGKRVLHRNGRYQIWNFRCHIFQWSNDIRFVRVKIWAYRIAEVIFAAGVLTIKAEMVVLLTICAR